MSLEFPCIYFDKDGKCRKFSSDVDYQYCVMGPCPEQKLSNADRIRDMSDEELASEMNQRSISTICDIVCQGDCKAIATLNKTSGEVCKEIIMKWLQQPAEEDT